MRFFISAFCLAIFLIGCSSNTGNLTITGNVKGLKKGSLLLQKFEDTTLITVDSMIIDGNSHFMFSEEIIEPEIFYLYVRLKDGSLKDDRIRFFAEEGTITINTTIDKFGSNAKISGSKNDSLLREYNKIKQRFTSRNLDIIEERLKLNSDSDSLILENEIKQQRLLSNQYYSTVNFAINNKEFEVAPYLILTETPFANAKYLDTVYSALNPKIKNSKYGKELESLIKFRKENDSTINH